MHVVRNNGMWDLVYAPIGKSVVGCRQVFSIKFLLDETLEHLKASDEGVNLSAQDKLHKYFSFLTKHCSMCVLLAFIAMYE